ncbi:hypothetical protein HPB48_008138 [Haemaphysalis longicornis]|uniref:FXNA-like protease n=1 Tax=Haemaphysalis longicornis TaxID=44386 RepID=A0A9J6FTP1_HAELO|nr:hypothetical protein HPB48_008138 [Haemaphysalis longicornis]
MACDARDGSLRYRQKGTNGVHSAEWNGVLHDGSNNGISLPNGQRTLPSRHRRRLLGEKFYACLLAFYLGSALLVFRLQSALPNVVTSDSEAEGHVFVGSRARQLLKELVGFGQRTVGSAKNELAAVDFVKRELGRIKDRARPVHKLEFDVQQPNGSFFLDFIDGFTSSYRGVKNVVARLASANELTPADQKHSLLVNCHYDSAPGSPGASDDAVNCAIMLEVLRVLSRRKQALRHPVIFLFNGAEENILQVWVPSFFFSPSSSELSTLLVWCANPIGVYWPCLPAGPSDPWLVRAYVEGAARPFGSIVAEEVFQSGLIPSDTDFRIFRDFKGLPGLDFAFAKNGYVYHTKYDNMDYIPDGSIQHAGLLLLWCFIQAYLGIHFAHFFFFCTGDNLLGLILKILEAPEMNDGTALGPKGKLNMDRSVYYDFLGLFMVTYSVSMSSLMVKLIVIVSVISMALRMKSSATCGTMSWFNRPYLVVGLYYGTMVAALMAVHWTITVLRRNRREITAGLKVLGDEDEYDDWDVLERYLDATQLLWLALVCFMALRTCSATTSLAVGAVRWLGPVGEKRGLLVAFMGAQWVPLLLTLYLCFNIHMAIVPITGRNGTSDNPEILVALMSGFLAAGCTSFVVRCGNVPCAVSSQRPD